MPLVRYHIRNEYGIADPEVYRAAEKDDDPEALLEGVAMAGLVGVLRQLGDLAEFAAGVFQDLHEDVMATSARGHGLILRVQQLEAEFPSIEKAILSQADHSHCVYNAGFDWHPNLGVEQNLVTQGDMPRFILDSYEECRGPPRLFMLDKFDVAGAGACLTRYSNPSFFKSQSASSEIMEPELHREKRPRKIKKRSCLRNGEMFNSFLTPIINYSQSSASEPTPEKLPTRLVKLKHRNLRVADIKNRESYMESLISEVFEQNDPKIPLPCYNIKESIDLASEVREDPPGCTLDSSSLREEFLPQLPKVTGEFQSEKGEGKDFLETSSAVCDASEKLPPAFQTVKEEKMMGVQNEMDIHDSDGSSDKNYMNRSPLQLAEHNNILVYSGFITDMDHDSYRSDDIGSELENYVDALNTLEIDLETDSESRDKSDPSFFNHQSRGIDPNISEHVELQAQSSGSGFDTLVSSETVMDIIPSLLQSSNLVDFPIQQLQLRTIFEETSSSGIKVNQGEIRKLEKAGENMELLPSDCLKDNETCHQKQPNAIMFAPFSRDALPSYCIADSALEHDENIKEAHLLATYSVNDIPGSTKSTHEHVKSSFLPWKPNHFLFPSKLKQSADVLEEKNLLGNNEDRISVTMADNDAICNSFITGQIILQEKASAGYSSDSPLTLLDDEIGKQLQMQEPEDITDFISESVLSSTPVGSIILESHDMPIDLEEVDIQSEYSAMKINSVHSENLDEGKQLNASLVIEDSGSHDSTQTFKNFVDDSAYISDERGSHHGILVDTMIGHFSGLIEKAIYNDASNTFQMPESPPKNSLVEVSTVYVKDSFHDPKDNDTYSVKNLSPENSTFSLDFVSSNLQLENLGGEIRIRSVTQEECVHQQCPESSGNVDILYCDASASPAVSYEFEQFPVVEESHESANLGILDPLLSGSREDSDSTQLQPEVGLIEINGEGHVNGGLEFADESTKLDLQYKLLVGESKKDNKSWDGNVINEDGVDYQVLNLLESAKVSGHKIDDILQEHQSVSVVSSSQTLAPYSSKFANATVSGHKIDDILYPCVFEESSICFREDEQGIHSDASMQHLLASAEGLELSEQPSVSEPSILPVHIKMESMYSPNIVLGDDYSDRHTVIQFTLEHEMLIADPKCESFFNHRSNNELNMPPSKEHLREQIETDPSVSLQDIFEYHVCSLASDDLASNSLVSEFISPLSVTGSREPSQLLPVETISGLPLQEGIDEIPPLPPLPPIQWRIGKPPAGSLSSDGYVAQPVVTKPSTFPLNMHKDQSTDSFMLPAAFKENFQHVSPCTYAQITEHSNLCRLPKINLDPRNKLGTQISENERVHSSGLSLITSSNGHDNFAMDREDPFALEARRPKLVKLLPGLELERLQEVPTIDAVAIPPFNSLMSMSTTGDGIHQYDCGDYGGENLQHYSLPASFPVGVHSFPHYGYHICLNEGDLSSLYDVKLPEMEGDIPNGKHRSVRNRRKDPLIEAVAAHDKSTLRKISELDLPMIKSKEDEPNYLLEQIKHKSFNLKPATSAKANILKAPPTNLKVAAILQKANAIRQACVGSDEEEDDDDWS